MSQQSVRQAARPSALDALAERRKQRADRERRLEGLAVAVLTALGERDAANDDRRRRPVAAGGGRVGHVSLETTSRRTRRSCQRRANRRRPNGPHGSDLLLRLRRPRHRPRQRRSRRPPPRGQGSLRLHGHHQISRLRHSPPGHVTTSRSTKPPPQARGAPHRVMTVHRSRSCTSTSLLSTRGG